ncbi:MAG: DUF2007 domain-containing protein [Chloroflexota bacterium]
MASSLSDFISVYNARGRLEGEMLKAFLESKGIRVILTQEGAAAAIGLSIGPLGIVEVLVDPENADEAHALLVSMEQGDYNDIEITNIEPDISANQ